MPTKQTTPLLYRTEPILFALAFWVYAYFYQAGGWNQNCRFDVVRSLVERGTHQIDPYADNTGDTAKVNEHYYCEKPPGLSWLGTLPYAGFRVFAASVTPDIAYLSAASYVVTLFTVTLPSAIIVVMLYVLLQIFPLSPAFRLLITVGYAFGTLAFPYSTLLYGHQLETALLFSAFTLLVRLNARQCSVLVLSGIGLLLGFTMAVEYSALIAILPILAYAWVKVHSLRTYVFMLPGIIGVGLVLAIYHTLNFGTPWTFAYHFSVQSPRHTGGFMGIGAVNLKALYAILFSSYRGLFYSAPWLLVGVVGILLLFARKRFMAEALVFTVIILTTIWLNASLVDWEGGWTVGPRYLIRLLPFLTAGAGGFAFLPFHPHRLARLAGLTLLALFIGYACFMMLVAAAVKPEVPIEIQRPFQDFLWPAFFQGQLALNMQSIDDLLPSSDGPPWAWNWGYLLGLDGLFTLIPLGMGSVLIVSWLIYVQSRKAPAG